MSWLSGWSKRLKLTIDSGKVDAALADFPILVYLSTSSGIGSADVSAVFDEIGSNSLKIAVTQSDGTTECYIEIEKWDSANEKAWLWIKVPSISASANTDLYLYYDSTHADNSTYVGVIGSTAGQNVWDSDFVAVHHLTGANYTDLDDSTANGNDVDSASGDPSYNATGKIASCIDLDGSDVVQISHDSSLVPSDEITVECIVKPNVADNIDYARFISVWHVTYGYGYLLRLDNASSPISQFYISDSGGTTRGPAQSTTTISNTSLWYALAGKFTGSALKLLINGSEEGSFDFTGSLNTSITTPLTIGGDFAASQTCFNGLIEEVRVSKIARSDAWLKATYHTCWDSLITFGSEETTNDVELSLPAFAAAAALLSTISVQLSVPPMAGQDTLSMDQIFFGRFVQCAPLTSISSLSGILTMNLAAPVLTSQSVMTGKPEMQLVAPAFIGTSVLSLSAILNCRYVTVPVFDASGSLNGNFSVQLVIPVFPGQSCLLVTPCIQLAPGPFNAVGLLLMASVNKFNIENAEIYYTFVLTGENDGTTDITIPISSFQARLRSGDPTYLSVAIPGTDYAGAISARPNGEMIVFMNYYSGGLLLQKEEIIRADLEDINTSKGAKSRSIVLTGHKTMTTGGKTITLRNPTYRNIYQGKYTYRCATPDIFLRPGDTVICGDDAFNVELITYVVSIAQQSMEITGA